MPELYRLSDRDAQIVHDASVNATDPALHDNPDVLGVGSSLVGIALSDTKVLVVNYRDNYLVDPLMMKGQVYRQRIAHMLFPDNFPNFYAGQGSYADDSGQIIYGFTIRERITDDANRWAYRDYRLPPMAECLHSYREPYMRRPEVKIGDRLLIAASYGIPLIAEFISANTQGHGEYAIYVDTLRDGLLAFQDHYLQGKLSWWNEDKIVELMDYMGRFTVQDKNQVLAWSRRAKYLEAVRLSIDEELLDPAAKEFDPKDVLPQVKDNFDRFCEQVEVQGMDFNAQEVAGYIDLMYRTKKALYNNRARRRSQALQ